MMSWVENIEKLTIGGGDDYLGLESTCPRTIIGVSGK